MRKEQGRTWVFVILLLVFSFVSVWGGNPKLKKNLDPCKQPPQLLSKPSKEDLAKGNKIRAQGSIGIAISEDGDVTDARVMNASSPAAADLLLARARSMKFAPRPGCGVFKTAVNFTLAGS